MTYQRPAIRAPRLTGLGLRVVALLSRSFLAPALRRKMLADVGISELRGARIALPPLGRPDPPLHAGAKVSLSLPEPPVLSELPAAPGVASSLQGNGTFVRWVPAQGTAKVAVQVRSGGQWKMVGVFPADGKGITTSKAEVVAVTALDRYGNASPPKVLGLQ